jgi:hypothetical protein
MMDEILSVDRLGVKKAADGGALVFWIGVYFTAETAEFAERKQISYSAPSACSAVKKVKLWRAHCVRPPSYGAGARPRNNKDTTKIIRNAKNKIFAIPAAVPANAPNPRIAAMIAIIRNVHTHDNILRILLSESRSNVNSAMMHRYRRVVQ